MPSSRFPRRSPLIAVTATALGALLLPVWSGAEWNEPATRLLIAPTGEAPGDFFGRSVSGAGDFNADGFDDILVGAPGNDAGGDGAGRAYVYFGGPQPRAYAEPDLTLTGEAAADGFGLSVSRAGDVNGDGFDDIIVGAHGNDAGGSYAGRAYVFLGGPAPDAVPDLVLTGPSPRGSFGFSVSGAGDVDGDGFDDLLVGAHTGGAGRAYLFLGGAAPDTTADLTFAGETDEDVFGYSVAGPGDFNDDGYDDLVVGARANGEGGVNAGRVYVFFGGPAADATPDRIMTGEAGARLGTSVSAPGDVDGDLVDDLIVGASANSIVVGRAYVFLGGSAADTIPDLTFSEEGAEDFFGGSVSGAGDVDGDGFDDLLVGASLKVVDGVRLGGAYLFLGGPGADAAPDLTLDGEASFDGFGVSLSGAGDFNGDGFDDLVIGANMNDTGGSEAGRVYVVDCNPPSTGVRAQPGITPTRLHLGSPRPNPLRSGSAVTLEIALPEDDRVVVSLLDVRGRRIASRAPERMNAGDAANVHWNPGTHPSGVYLLHVAGRTGTATRRLVILE